MPKITYIDAQGTSRTVEGEAGSTVMEVAVRNGVPGIEAECGGACACATCHVYVDEAWTEKTGHAEPMEEDMLDFAFDVRPNSRLSCQIRVRDELDGRGHVEHQAIHVLGLESLERPVEAIPDLLLSRATKGHVELCRQEDRAAVPSL